MAADPLIDATPSGGGSGLRLHERLAAAVARNLFGEALRGVALEAQRRFKGYSIGGGEVALFSRAQLRIQEPLGCVGFVHRAGIGDLQLLDAIAASVASNCAVTLPAATVAIAWWTFQAAPASNMRMRSR